MKKSLLAVAAIGAFASAAQAQSSVTVYGILDVGYVGENTRLMNSNTTTNGGATKATGNQFGASAESTSRLGFKGNEDLGGGMSAFFTAEFTLEPSSAATGSGGAKDLYGSTGTSTGGLQNRQTFVGLKKNGIGQFAVGTQYTPIHSAVAATDAGQANNIMGNVIYPFATGSATSLSGNSAQGNTSAYTVRVSNALTVASDTFAGFQVNGLLVANNKNSSQTAATGTSTTAGGTDNYNGWGLGANYTWKKLFATVNYQALKAVNPYNGLATAATATAPASVQVWNGPGANSIKVADTPQNIQDNQFYAAATYDFGILKAYAQYVSRKATSSANTNYFLKRSAEQIGVRSFITPTIEGWASAGLGRYTAFGDGAPTVNFNAWQLGSNYWLSKRTNLYAIYGQTLTSNGAYTTSSTGGTTSGTYSMGGSNYAIGVRHTF